MNKEASLDERTSRRASLWAWSYLMVVGVGAAVIVRLVERQGWRGLWACAPIILVLWVIRRARDRPRREPGRDA